MSKESKLYIRQDVCTWGWKPTWKDWLLGNTSWYIYHFLIHLRSYEFYYRHNSGGVSLKRFGIIFVTNNLVIK